MNPLNSWVGCGDGPTLLEAALRAEYLTETPIWHIAPAYGIQSLLLR